MGKWSDYKDTLPARPRDERARQEAERLLAEGGIERATEAYLKAREAVDDLKAQTKAAQETLDTAELAVLLHFERHDLSRIDRGGFALVRSEQPYAQIADKGALLAWANEEAPEIVNVNWNSLQSKVKTALEDTAPLPPGVDVFFEQTIRRNKKG